MNSDGRTGVDSDRQRQISCSPSPVRQQLISQWFSMKSSAVTWGRDLRSFFFRRVILWVSLGWVTWAEYRSPRPERALRMCAGGGRVLSVPSLLHWAESNLPFFEYLLWERCLDCRRSHPTFTGRQRRRWLAAATYPNPPILSGAHLPARLSWLPTGNWDIPPHSPLITKVTWHMYSWRWANLHCGHIFPRPLSVSARCPFEASLPSQVIKDPVVSHLAGPIIKSET